MKTGLGLKRKVNAILNIANSPLQIGKDKIFCISMQRNGTTSVGDFLIDHKFRVAREHHGVTYGWNYLCSIGDFESIFRSLSFKSFQTYEDSPWWYPDFYKILYHRFPNAKFILFYRDSDKWFDSMVSLKNGKTLGNTRTHCKIYRRLGEFYKKIDTDLDFKPSEKEKDQLMRLDSMREHYIRVYEEYNREAIEYFAMYNPKRFFVSRLENKKKWQDLGVFLGVNVEDNYEVHSNRSKS